MNLGEQKRQNFCAVIALLVVGVFTMVPRKRSELRLPCQFQASLLHRAPT